ncbi:hypothetical protein Cgig2_020724 [Carnegiea gigantea]|uniref:Protein FAR1-RELATED SEQUENCE n=1 Tax=Carnegiea gigantea TaxID=171969 RepID=A0A9Q1H021_9CARY|nr:hypothetical protein Cgig2_020724 [Carnegiea gigantea]
MLTTHTRDLLSPSEMRFLPTKRSISPEDESRTLLYKDASLSVRQIVRVIELENNVQHGTLPFLDRDIHNLFVKVRKKLAASDMKDLLDYLKFEQKASSKFYYAFTTFISMMGKTPKTTITDQDPWLTDAIVTEMSITKHIFCIWHITSKFSGWFCTILHSDYQYWCANFFKLYSLTLSKEFEPEWPLLVEKYDLINHKHI